MQKVAPRLASGLRDFEVPRDGMRRYLYDIWQPLMLLALTASFTAAFFTHYDPSVSLKSPNDGYFCNADGKLEELNWSYEPFWDARLYFTVNMAFGQFSFSSAKVIDAAWDAVVGRGGQFIAAAIAYRTLRRSFTLTMETCTVTIPAATSFYCRQIQLESVSQLIHTMLWHWNSIHLTWRLPVNLARLRLCTQLFVCIYVLLFTTLTSVMTGYSAQLAAFTGPDDDGAGPLFPINQLVRPRLGLSDGARVGLPQNTFARNAIVYPASATIFSPNETSGGSIKFNLTEFLANSRDFEEPWGTLLDYYYTSEAVYRWVDAEMYRNAQGAPPFKPTTARSLNCASHNCSCSAPPIPHSEWSHPRAVMDSASSTITIGGRYWNLPAPWLSVGVTAYTGGSDWVYEDIEGRQPQKASDFWSGTYASDVVEVTSPDDTVDTFNGSWYMYNETLLTKADVINNGRCIAEEAYSWGFSSLLLLTFCCYTFAFALALIALQTDVYWNSRHDRDHQSHSIYTDVLYLAAELKNTFGQSVEDHLHSPKAFDKKVGEWKQGLRLDVRDLPLSRWQEWRMSRATNRADRKAKIASAADHDPTLELHNLSSRKRGGSAYHGLIGGGGESNVEAVANSDDGSSAEKLAPSLGGRRTSTENSFHDGAALEGSVQGSYCVWGTHAADVVPEGWGSRDQPPTTG